MDAVVMDGTAFGILGTLTEFERTSLTVPAIQRILRLQYIMKVPRGRAFVDELLLSARSGIDEVEFWVALKRKLYPHQTTLIQKISWIHQMTKKSMLLLVFTAWLRNTII